MIQLLPAPLTLSITRPDNSSMNLESRRARRAFSAFGIAWNVALPLLVLFSSWPFRAKAGYLLYGALGRRQLDRPVEWEGRSSRPSRMAVRRLLVASGLMFLGVFVFRT